MHSKNSIIFTAELLTQLILSYREGVGGVVILPVATFYLNNVRCLSKCPDTFRNFFGKLSEGKMMWWVNVHGL